MIAAVHARSWEAAYRGLLSARVIAEVVEGRERRAARLRDELREADGPRSGWVGELNGSIVGFAIVGPSRDRDARRHVGELEAIYLLPDAVGHGVGRALLEHAIGDLRERGFNEATLWVLESNQRARRFYEAAGWHLDGATKDEERQSGILHEVRYCRRLAKRRVRRPGGS